ncbi:MAG: hypothetical protein HUK01_04535 [Bacteroidaceae bacterium]|nr:hypothetical protein [Bacteroidaceae bacterium]
MKSNSPILRYTSIVAIVIATSLFYFPFEFSFLPGVNTKMMMAALGLVFLGFNLTTSRSGEMGSIFLTISAVACLFSISCFVSIALNNTTDMAYVTYIMSMWVWLGGAYSVVTLIKKRHGRADLRTIAYYLCAVCVAQCLLSQLIDNNPSFKQTVDAYVLQNQDFLTEVERLYGIGASLDVAGVRFSLVLVTIGFLLTQQCKKIETVALLASYATIVTLGNMISRTTVVGAVLGACMFVLVATFSEKAVAAQTKTVTRWSFVVILSTVALFIFLYNTDEAMRKQLRFGFEGFFSLVEKGHWETTSNEQLQTMVVFPDNTKTWLIGDGYFENPAQQPYFTGKLMHGYYMGTDIGYCRFIFYCGLIGLFAFSMVIVTAAYCCSKRLPDYRYLFAMLVVVNFIVWAKVSTDTFLIFALMLLADPDPILIGADETEAEAEAAVEPVTV